MMGWLAVVILIFGALFLIDPITLQRGWQVGLAGLLVGGLAGLLVGEALGCGLAQRELVRRQRQMARAESRTRGAPSTVAVTAPDLELPSVAPSPPVEPTSRVLTASTPATVAPTRNEPGSRC